MSNSSIDTANLESLLEYNFRNVKLLTLALTHPSNNKNNNNQRLEFLGDSVLGLIIAKMLYEAFPGAAEGELARRQAALVCGDALVEVAREIGIGKYLIISASEESAGGRETGSNLEDAVEAIIGALYLDGGLEAAEMFVKSHWLKSLKEAITPPKDAKTTLQEWAQGLGFPLPAYIVVDSSGPAHSPLFTVEVSVDGNRTASASANSKRAAEQLAAKTLLDKISLEHAKI